jgi:arsenate reductase (thioredoxin)
MRSKFFGGLSRRTAILSVAALLVAAKAPGKRAPRVLFVCLHGTVKSPIARELLRGQAWVRGFAIKVQSRGIEPEEGASPEVAAALVRDGIAVKHDPLRALTPVDTAWADVVVFFDPLPFAPGSKDLRDWRDTPSVNQHYAEALALMRSRIAALLDELAQRGRFG